MTAKTCLYRFFSEADVLLYVGISGNPFQRRSGHFSEKPMDQVRHIEMEWFNTRQEAGQAEVIAIKTERPLWNVMHVPAPRACRVTQIKPVEVKTTSEPTIKITPMPKRKGPKPFGPPKPYYKFALCNIEDKPEGMNHVVCPDDLFDLLGGLRAGDLVWVGPDVDLPDDFWDRVFALCAYQMPESWVKFKGVA